MIISIDDGKIHDIVITGDFFIEPPDAMLRLCEELRNIEINDYHLMAKVLEDFIRRNNIMMLGITVNDLIEAIRKANS